MRPLMPWRVVAIGLAVGALLVSIEVCLVIRLLHANGRDPVGMVVAVVLAVALLANYVAGVAATRTAQLHRGGVTHPAPGLRWREVLSQALQPVLPSRVPALVLSVGAAVLVVEAVLVFLLREADARGPVGVIVAVLIGVALLANFAAGVAAARGRQHRGGAGDPAAESARSMPPGRSADEISRHSAQTGLQSLLVLPGGPSLAVGIVVAVAAIAVETFLVWLLQHQDPGEAFEPIYLLGVLVVSAGWGLGLAVGTSLASAMVLAYVRGWQSGHFVPFNFENGVIVLVFLAVALCTNFVAGLARAREIEADDRRREADDRRREAEVAAAMLRDSRDSVTALATQQEALRRVATLVALGVSPSEVFSAVAEEMARCLQVESAQVLRYEPDGAVIVVASYAVPGVQPIPVGERLTLEGDDVPAMVLRTRGTARMDSHEDAAGSLATRIRELGLRSRVGAPIVVDQRVWGVAIVGSSRPEPLANDTEERIGDFADLVATALANAATRTELIASRARIVAAADDARRRLERDLHDGAQQRLVSLELNLRIAKDSVPAELDALKNELSDLLSGVTGISTDLREISLGIHPAILSEGGLGPALKSLARRSTVPVSVDVTIEQRLPDAVEVAAYYVAAEALTNAAKHAQASEVRVRAETGDDTLLLSIQDNGIGGADSRSGSGLIGLKDRVEALGGQMLVESPCGSGTAMRVTIPIAAR
jgi:signal transduction histidine kinase